LLLCLLTFATHGRVEGVVVDKIYHPYVIAFEKELEWRMIYQDQQPGMADNFQMHQIAFGWADWGLLFELEKEAG